MIKYKGIDVSKYQGKIDWAKVKADNITFAMLRAGITDSNGNLTIDTTFRKNLEGASAAGIPVGIYVYLKIESEEAAAAAAEQVIALTRDSEITYPVAGDFEDKKYFSMSRETNSRLARAFLSEVAKRNFYPIFYTYTAFTQAYLNMKELEDYDLWIADYRENLGYKGKYTMWQHSSTGSVNGITTAVDLDISYVDYPSRIREQGKNNLHPSTPTEKWKIDIYSFKQESRAKEVAEAFRVLNLYSEVRENGSEWAIDMYSFEERTRAEEISTAIKTMGFYNEVKPLEISE